MLKLLKHEFIHSMRTYGIAFGIFLIYCIIYPILANVTILQEAYILQAFMIFGLFGITIGIFIAMVISIFLNYYRSMFQKPAYLTLTLPVSTKDLIISKVLMTLVWVCIGIGVYVVGYGLLIIISNIISEGSLYSSWDVIVKEIRYLFNVETIKYILFGIYEILSTIILMISTIYFSLTLTHTKWFRKHRVLIGVIIFLVLSYIIQALTGFIVSEAIYYDERTMVVGTFQILLSILMIFSTIYIINHHIEIE